MGSLMESIVFNYRNQFWIWCIVCGPLAGGLTGALFYDLFIFTGGESWVNRPSTAARRHFAKAPSGERANPIAGPTIGEEQREGEVV